MATKTDYYDRIISSLQSDITRLRNSLTVLEKNIADIKNTYSSPDATSSSNQSENEKLELMSQLAKACQATIEKRFSGLSARFVDRETFKIHCEHTEADFLSKVTFNTFKESIENSVRIMEKKINQRFSFLTINRWKRDCDAEGTACSGLDTFLHIFTMNRYTRWLILFLVSFSLIIVLLSAISENKHIRQENHNLYQTIELLKTSQK